MEPGPADPPPPAPADSARRPPYRPLGRRAGWTIGLLLLAAVLDVIALGSDALEWALVERITSGELITDAEANANDLRQGVIGAAQGAVFILTAVVFIAWLHRAYTNLRALGAPSLRFGPGWAIGAWFVPILSWWRPKQITNDTWRGSNPLLPPDEADAWRDPVPRLFAFWWGAFLLSQWLYSVASRLSFRADEVSGLKTSTGLWIAADGVGAVSAVLALLVVRRTTARQAARAAALGVVPEPDPTPVWRRKSAWAALAATLAAFALQAAIGVAAWTGALDEGTSGSAAPPGPPAPSDPNVLLEDDFSRPGAWLSEDSAEMTFGYTAGTYRIIIKEAEALWSTAVGLPRREGAISVEVDMSLAEGRVRTDYYGVGCVAASQGSYLFGISPDGYYTIAADPGGDDEIEVNRVIEERADEPFRAGEAANRVRAECVQNGQRALLRLSVNGLELVETRHQPSLGGFIGVQFFVFSGRGDTEVRFDDLLVERLDER